MKIPSSKFQVPNKFQAPNSKSSKPKGQSILKLGAWNLEFLWNLELGTWNFLGAWMLVLGIYCSGCSTAPNSASFASVVIHGKTDEEIRQTTSEVFQADGYKV